MRRREFLLFTCLTLAGGSSASAGQLPQQFVNVYRPALERLREAYQKVTVTGTLRVELPAEEKSSEQGFVLRADGQKRRLDLRTLAQRRMGLEVGATEMSMATPIGSLNTYTRDNSKFFDDAQERKYDGVVAEIDEKCLLTYPYALDSQSTILDLLQSSAVKVKKVRWVRPRGQAVVQVDYEEIGLHAGRSGTWISSLVLSPDDGWALRSFQRTLGTGSDRITQSGDLSYSSGADSIPLVQAIELETARGDKVTRRESVSVTEVDFGAPDSEYFDSFTF